VLGGEIAVSPRHRQIPPTAFQPAALPRKTEYARQQILEAIRKGLFAVGDRLPPERELAALLGVGRSSVREALSMLQIAGVVEVRHGSGVFVRNVPGPEQAEVPLDFLIAEQDFLTLTQARYVVERGIVALAVEEADPRGLDRMRSALEDMDRSLEESDISLFLKANISFHEGLARAGQNPILEAFSQKLLRQLDQPKIRSVRSFFYQVDLHRLIRAVETHRQIYNGIVAGNRDLALDAIYRHYADVVAPIIGQDPAWR